MSTKNINEQALRLISFFGHFPPYHSNLLCVIITSDNKNHYIKGKIQWNNMIGITTHAN